MKGKRFWTRAMKRRKTRFLRWPWATINRMHQESLRAERELVGSVRLSDIPRPIRDDLFGGKPLTFPVAGGRGAH